ncbi:hypothetical protein F-LCD7_0256 [Faustovirus]|nr:hypothetical protein F-LCD7_0256 [Faustovirus]
MNTHAKSTPTVIRHNKYLEGDKPIYSTFEARRASKYLEGDKPIYGTTRPSKYLAGGQTTTHGTTRPSKYSMESLIRRIEPKHVYPDPLVIGALKFIIGHGLFTQHVISQITKISNSKLSNYINNAKRVRGWGDTNTTLANFTYIFVEYTEFGYKTRGEKTVQEQIEELPPRPDTNINVHVNVNMYANTLTNIYANTDANTLTNIYANTPTYANTLTNIYANTDANTPTYNTDATETSRDVEYHWDYYANTVDALDWQNYGQYQ